MIGLLMACMLVAMNGWGQVVLSPENGAKDVCIDTHLSLTFDKDVTIGKKGKVKVWDAETGKMVDMLDLSIPAGPTASQPNNPNAIYTPTPYIYKEGPRATNRNTKAGTPSGANQWDRSRYQWNIIGGFSDAFHFYPIIVHGKKATIYLHNNMLDYGKEYYVTMDKGVIEGFEGIKKGSWRFKIKAPSKSPRGETLNSNSSLSTLHDSLSTLHASRSTLHASLSTLHVNPDKLITVAADGTGDFCTLQGALDYVPDFAKSEAERWTIFVKNGEYEEIVYARNKCYVTIVGESRDGVLVHYANNEVFNPHPADIKTNELKGTFPSRRAATSLDNCHHLVLKNITFQTDCKGQAEGLLLNGSENYAENVRIVGSGDALQVNGSAYWMNCEIDGDADTILGRGPSFFNHCTLKGSFALMWIRNTEENHGNVFVDCTLVGKDNRTSIARLPSNHGKNYPHAECVLLNCTLVNIVPMGYETVAEEARTAHLWEFNSHDEHGKPIDTSKRHPFVKQLDPIKDAEVIARYHDYRYVWQTRP